MAPGSEVVGENGFDFLVIDANCNYWVQLEAGGEARTGVLDSNQVGQLEDELRPASWKTIAGTYSTSLCDGPWHRYRYGSYAISVYPGCHGPNSFAPVEWVRHAARAAIERLHERGVAVGGPVRYVLVYVDVPPTPKFDGYRNAPVWPLATPAASQAISMTQAMNYSTSYSRLATGRDAQLLRDIVSRFEAGEIGRAYSGFVPVKDGDSLYQLFARDTVPFEDQHGLWRVQ